MGKKKSFFVLSLVTLAAASGRAQDNAVEAPVIARPDFSQIVGNYRISATAAPTEVRVEEPITLTVQITGQGPAKYRPERGKLRIFSEDLADSFYLEPLADQDKSLPEEGRWEFIYRLRPKRADVTRVPGLHLLYFDPDKRQFQSSFADEIPITVTRRQEEIAEAKTTQAAQPPARFHQQRSMDEVLHDDRPLPSPGPGLLAAVLAMPPLAGFVCYRVWRRLYPNAAECRQRRRSRAARLALARLGKQPADVRATRAGAVDYLRERLDLAAVEATPTEVAGHLKCLGIAKPLIGDWTAFLRACDCCQFAQTAATLATDAPATHLHDQAIRLIHLLEADPCACR